MKIYNQQITTVNESLDEGLLALKDTLMQVKYFLRVNYSKWSLRKNYLYDKPWYLVIGPSQSGKSTLLRNSGVQFSQILTQKSQYCSGWIASEAVYFDMNGRNFFSKELASSWKSILAIFKVARRRLPINGVIFTLNLFDILSQSKLQRETLFNDYMNVIKELTSQSNKQIPIYLVFTHLDLLSGFADFFDDYSHDDRNQPCGFMVPSKQMHHSLNNYVSYQFDRLVKVINQGLIKRLHQAQGPRKKALINDFPLQLESIKNIILDFVKLFSSARGHKEKQLLRGVFICSSCQTGTPVDQLSKPIAQTFALQLPALVGQHFQERSFFIKRLLTEIIPTDYKFSDKALAMRKEHLFRKTLSYAAVVAFAVLAINLLSKGFISNVNFIHTASESLMHYQMAKENKNFLAKGSQGFNVLLESLNILLKANRELDKQPLDWLNLYPLTHIADVKKQLRETYQSAVHFEFLPMLANYIESNMSRIDVSQPQALYAALKTYLMIGYPKHMQSDYFVQWVENNWEKDPNIDSDAIPQMIKTLKNILAYRLPAVDLNIDKIREIRGSLNTLPKSFVAYLLLQNDTFHNNIKLFESTENTVFVNNDYELSIPYIYTKGAFNEIYEHEITRISNLILRGDWVLGRRQLLNATDTSNDVLERELRKLYINDYVMWWQQFLKKLRMRQVADTSQMLTLYQQLAGKDSPLEIVQQAFYENTSPILESSMIAQVFNQYIANQFAHINGPSFFVSKRLKTSFKQIADSFQKMSAGFDSDAVAFNMAKRYFSDEGNMPLIAILQEAEDAVPPMQEWLRILAGNTWQLISNKTQAYINQQWTNNILREYKTNILNRYPIKREAEQEISLINFTHFFAPQGSLNVFFRDYIQPFLNMKNAFWEPKRVNGITLGISKQAIEQFVRANLIRKMFFSNADSTVNIKFSLTPVSFQPIVKDMVLNINGKKVLYYPGSHKVTRFTWPAYNMDNAILVTIKNVSGEQTTIEEFGSWALFKLFDKANLSTTPDMQKYDLIFILKGSAVKYRLTANSPVNPFVPGIIETFQLPDVVL